MIEARSVLTYDFLVLLQGHFLLWFGFWHAFHKEITDGHQIRQTYYYKHLVQVNIHCNTDQRVSDQRVSDQRVSGQQVLPWNFRFRTDIGSVRQIMRNSK